MKNSTFYAIMIIMFILIGYLITDAILTGTDKSGYITIRVCDGFTEAPLKNARVVIPEVNSQAHTNDDGYTYEMKVPIIRDKHFDKIKKQSYGRITVIVYADGYIPYGIFFVQIKENEHRAINAWLFEDDGSSDPFVIIESPDNKWANELINSYR